MNAANSKMVDAARNRLGSAQIALSGALERGDDTAEARSRVTQAQTDLENLLTQAGAEASKAEAERRRQVAEAANAETRATVQQVAARLREMVSIQVPSIELPAGIVAAVLEARARAAAAADAAGAAQARVTHLQARQQEMEQRRAAITAKRQAGQGDDARDGAELALIQADSDGLSALVEQAVADAEGPVRQAEAAAIAIASAEQMWQQAITQAEAHALAQVCAAVETSLVAIAAALYPHRGAGIPAWRPSLELRHIFEYGAPRRVA